MSTASLPTIMLAIGAAAVGVLRKVAVVAPVAATMLVPVAKDGETDTSGTVAPRSTEAATAVGRAIAGTVRGQCPSAPS